MARSPGRTSPGALVGPHGELEEDDLHPPARSCGSNLLPHHRWDDEDVDNNNRHLRSRGFISRISSWLDGKGKSREHQLERDRSRNWFHGEPSKGRNRGAPNTSIPPLRGTPSCQVSRSLAALARKRLHPATCKSLAEGTDVELKWLLFGL
jgi:hypothetical protein